jgi:two-component system, OmpR family, sensor histidine kinase KdpD
VLVGRRSWLGALASLSLVVIAVAAMVPLRAHLAVATDALIFVIPIVVGVAIGGFVSGSIGAAAGFLAYDFFFIPPYNTLSVGGAQNWVALVVYAVVVLVVARVVAVQQSARVRAAAREDAVQRLYLVTEQLISARPVDDLLAAVATTVHDVFHTRWAAVLVPEGDHLALAAVAGGPLSDGDTARVLDAAGAPQALTLVGADGEISRVALASERGAVGQLVVAGARLTAFERELLATFANQASLAIERGQLRERALRTEELEEADQWRRALVGAVSHDLRTPLASMKVAVTTLRTSGAALNESDRAELLAMIDEEGDHLARLVANVLDMARIEAGSLALAREPHSIEEVLEVAERALGVALATVRLVTDVDDDLPLLDIDLVLIGQVVANLLSNAVHHAPVGSTVTVGARMDGDRVRVWVDDEGPGVPALDRDRIFHMLDRRAGSGRAGLGLTIASQFVAAHGGSIVVSDAPCGGARFTFYVDASPLEETDA